MERLCDELYWIHDSCLIEHGEPRKVIRNYMDFLNESEEKRLTEESVVAAVPNEDAETKETATDDKRWGNKLAEITGVKMVDAAGEEKHFLKKVIWLLFLLIM